MLIAGELAISLIFLSPVFPDPHASYTPKHVIYGLSRELFDSFSTEDKLKIIKNVEIIETYIHEIEEIKNNKLKDLWLEKIKTICNTIKDDKLCDWLMKNSKEFFDEIIWCRDVKSKNDEGRPTL